jgi:hypothetical protein
VGRPNVPWFGAEKAKSATRFIEVGTVTVSSMQSFHKIGVGVNHIQSTMHAIANLPGSGQKRLPDVMKYDNVSVMQLVYEELVSIMSAIVTILHQSTRHPNFAICGNQTIVGRPGQRISWRDPQVLSISNGSLIR